MMLSMEPQSGADFSMALAYHSRKILRPSGVLSKKELAEKQSVLEELKTYCETKLIPYCFCTRDMKLPVVDTAVRIYREYLEEKRIEVEQASTTAETKDEKEDEAVLESVFDSSIRNGIAKMISDECAKIDWNGEEAKYSEDFRAALETGCWESFVYIERLINNVVPEDLRAECFITLAKNICAFLDTQLKAYYDCISTLQKVRSEKLLFILEAVDKIRNKALADAKKKPREFAMPTYKACFELWITAQKGQVMEWTKRAIEVDKMQPMGGDMMYSSSICDTFSAVEQAVKFAKRVVIDDVDLLLSVHELILEAIELYLNEENTAVNALIDERGKFMFSTVLPIADPEEESDKAVLAKRQAKPKKEDDDDEDEETKREKRSDCLHKFGIMIANIEHCKESVDDLTRLVDAFVDKWKSDYPDLIEEVDAVGKEIAVKTKEKMDKPKVLVTQILRKLMYLIPEAVRPITASAARFGFEDRHVDMIQDVFDGALVTLQPFFLSKTMEMFAGICFKCVFYSFAEVLDPANIKNAPGQYFNNPVVPDSFSNAISVIRDYFLANKDVLKESTADQCVDYIKAVRRCYLYCCSTRELVSHYNSIRDNKIIVLGIKEMQLVAGETEEVVRKEMVEILIDRSKMKDGLAVAFMKEHNGNNESDIVRKHFILRPSELVIDTWACKCDGVSGKICLTSESLCFDRTINDDAASDSAVIIELQFIQTLKAEKMGLTTRQLTVEYKVSDTSSKVLSHVFSSFRSNVYGITRIIYKQCRLMDNKSVRDDTDYPEGEKNIDGDILDDPDDDDDDDDDDEKPSRETKQKSDDKPKEDKEKDDDDGKKKKGGFFSGLFKGKK